MLSPWWTVFTEGACGCWKGKGRQGNGDEEGIGNVRGMSRKKGKGVSVGDVRVCGWRGPSFVVRVGGGFKVPMSGAVVRVYGGWKV